MATWVDLKDLEDVVNNISSPICLKELFIRLSKRTKRGGIENLTLIPLARTYNSPLPNFPIATISKVWNRRRSRSCRNLTKCSQAHNPITALLFARNFSCNARDQRAENNKWDSWPLPIRPPGCRVNRSLMYPLPLPLPSNIDPGRCFPRTCRSLESYVSNTVQRSLLFHTRKRLLSTPFLLELIRINTDKL